MDNNRKFYCNKNKINICCEEEMKKLLFQKHVKIILL